MHIPDGFIDPYLCALFGVISFAFLFWAWRETRKAFPSSFVPMIAVSSALVFAAQMINFPIVYGTSGHLIGGTFLAMLLGPHAAIISMTIVVFIQAILFADGGIFTFGANVFNMAVIGGLSFYVVKFLLRTSSSRRRLSASVFFASWFSIISSSMMCALQIGVSSAFISAGGILATIPTMLFWHTIIGIGEAVISTALVTQLSRINLTFLIGLATLQSEKV